METLYNILYNLYIKELDNLTIGYAFDSKHLTRMNDIANAIQYMKHTTIPASEELKIIQFYERNY